MENMNKSKNNIKIAYKMINRFIERHLKLSDTAIDELDVIIKLLEEGECDN